MAGRRHEGEDRVCGCDRDDGSCAGLVVRRLSDERVRELAEEIWTASSGTAMAIPAVPLADPRGGEPGASAQAAYQRHRQQEVEVWRRGRWWRALAAAVAAVGGGLLIGTPWVPGWDGRWRWW
jgi:hypothetical protein